MEDVRTFLLEDEASTLLAQIDALEELKKSRPQSEELPSDG